MIIMVRKSPKEEYERRKKLLSKNALKKARTGLTKQALIKLEQAIIREKQKNKEVKELEFGYNALQCLDARVGQKLVVIYDSEKKKPFVDSITTVAQQQGINIKPINIRTEFEKNNDPIKVVQVVGKEIKQFYGRSKNQNRNAITLIGKNDPYSQVRGKMVGKIIENKGYTLHIPTDKMKTAKRLLKIDPARLEKKAQALTQIMENAVEFIVTTEKGTKIVVPWNSNERKWITSVGKVKKYSGEKGGWGNPGGEVFTSPDHFKVNGVIIADGAIGDLGLTKKLIKIEVENGKANLKKIKNKQLKRELTKDGNANIAGELGIGLTPGKLIGDLLLDEKIEGTCHIAFGDSEASRGTGGTIKSEGHTDVIINKPTIVMKDKQGRLIKVMNKGKLLY